MAIDLSHIKKNKISSKAAVVAPSLKEQIARPWESFENKGQAVRTVQAHEAIRKINSKERRESNIVSFKVYKQERESQAPKNLYGLVNAPLHGSGLVGFIRRLFF